MPSFHYKAVTPGGDFLEGDVEKDSAAEAIRYIQDSGNIPISAEERRSAAKRVDWRLRRSSSRQGNRQLLLSFTRSMASLLGAGVALDRALEIVGDVEDDTQSLALIDCIQQSIRGGDSLSAALADSGGLFPDFYVSMVRSAEAGGNVAAGMQRLVEYLEYRQQIRDKVVSALTYPVILMLVAGISVIVLLTYVVPQFRSLFDDMGPALPLATRAVLAVSDGFAAYGWLLVPALLLAAVAIRRQLAVPAARLRLDRIVLQAPLLGPLLRDVQTTQFARSLGSLLQSGVPMLRSLEIARDALTNRVMLDELERAAASLKQGGLLADTLVEARVFPSLAIQLIKVGEETGSLDTALLSVASIYDQQVETRIQRLLSLLEPVLIIGLGAVIAIIIMSILIGIVSVNDLPL